MEGIDYFPPLSEKELEAKRIREEKKALRKKSKSVVIREGKILKEETDNSEVQEQ